MSARLSHHTNLACGGGGIIAPAGGWDPRGAGKETPPTPPQPRLWGRIQPPAALVLPAKGE